MSQPQAYTVGDARIMRIEDCVLDSFEPRDLLPDWTEHLRDSLALMPETLTADRRHVLLSIHSWVIQLNGKTIVVDTGAGNDKVRPFARYFDHLKTPYIARLEAAGVSPDDVDFVLHTHLHVDHVGWNTTFVDGSWAPTFRNAQHVFSAKEYRYFTDPANLSERNRTSFQVQVDSVTPIVEAGMAKMIVVSGEEAIPGFSFHSTPGHTVDHASIVLESAGVRALFAGDVVHHPMQILQPTLMSVFDPEPAKTLLSRRWALDFAVDRDAMLFSSHFSATSAGRVTRSGDAYRWRFE